MASIRIMTVQFDKELRHGEVPLFRGAVIGAAGEQHTMFHNHTATGFVYRYPLIQYRSFGRRAAIVCINEGIEQMQALFGGNFLVGDLMLGSTNKGKIAVESIRVHEFRLSELDAPVRYHIARWIPFNQSNYKEWQAAESPEERLHKIESILAGNIISFAKGVGWQIENRFTLSIVPDSIHTLKCRFKGQMLIALSLDFEVGLFLPSGIGLGKGVVLNHGVVFPAK